MVKKGEKEAILKSLKEGQIPAPSDLDWDKMIVEVEPLYSAADDSGLLSTSKFEPYSSNSRDILRFYFQNGVLIVHPLRNVLLPHHLPFLNCQNDKGKPDRLGLPLSQTC